MKKISVILIEDEPYSRAELRHLLSSEERIEIVAEADSGEKGLEMIIAHEPDVIFVDINMPQMTGIELIQIIQKMRKRPLVVFATAYPDYAAKAFRLNAIDYLLKPFDEDQLKETLERIDSALTNNDLSKEDGYMKFGKLGVEEDGKIVYILPTDIHYLYREDRETIIRAKNGKYICKLPLKELEQKLKDFPFFRTHKSYLVNLNAIVELIPWFNGAFVLKIDGVKEKVPVSRNYVKALRKKLEL